MRTLKYLLADHAKDKARVHQLYFIGALLQYNVKNGVFFEAGKQIWRIITGVCQLFWKIIEAKEINVWNE